MSIKMYDLNREQVEKLILEYKTSPVYVGQNPYIGSGPTHEILAVLLPDGFYQVELLDKQQMEESHRQTIKAFEEYTARSKRDNPSKLS